MDVSSLIRWHCCQNSCKKSVAGAASILARRVFLWIFYLLAGALAAWRTGKRSTGIIASFWINLWYLVGIIAVFFLPRSHTLRTYYMSSQGYTTGFLLFALISFVISIGLGAGFGTLGGLMGKALKK